MDPGGGYVEVVLGTEAEILRFIPGLYLPQTIEGPLFPEPGPIVSESPSCSAQNLSTQSAKAVWKSLRKIVLVVLSLYRK